MADKNGKKHDLPENERPKQEADLAAEFAALGKKFAEALNTAWNSEERQNIQQELREGVNRFAAEVDKASKKVRESSVGQKVEEGVKQATTEVKAGKVGEDIRTGLVKALRGLGEAIDRMADSFTSGEDADTPKE